MKHLSQKVVDTLEKIWPGQVKECLKKQACSYVGRRLNELSEKELISELSLKGHQCKFA